MAKWRQWRDNDGTADTDYLAGTTTPSTDLFRVSPGEGPLQVTARVVDSSGDTVARGSCSFRVQILEIITSAGKTFATEASPIRSMKPGQTWTLDAPDSSAGATARSFYVRVVDAVANQPGSFDALRFEGLSLPR